LLKTDNLDGKVRKGLIMPFTETVNWINDSTSPDELWNCIRNMGQQCPYNSSEGTCKKWLLKVSKVYQAQPADEENLKKIQEFHKSLVVGHSGWAKYLWLAQPKLFLEWDEKGCRSIRAEVAYLPTKQWNSQKDPRIFTTVGDTGATMERSEHELHSCSTSERRVQCNMGSGQPPTKNATCGILYGQCGW
jgi:hypothetical protein